MNISPRQHLFPIFLGAMLILLVGVWGASEILRTYAQRVKNQQRQAVLAADFIEAGIRSLLLKPTHDGASLERYFADLEKRVGVSCALVNGEGVIIFGSPDAPPPPKEESGISVQGRKAVVWRTLRLSGVTIDTMKFMARVDLRKFGKDEADEGDALLIGLFFGCCGMTVLALAWSYSTRNRNLQMRLSTAKEREDHSEELSLAAAGLAHETKNPLGIIRGLAQRIAEGDVDPEKIRGMARDIMEEADITTARLGDFMCYAKIREPEPAPVDIRELVQRMITLVSHEFEDADVALEAKTDDIILLADGEMLSQALMNLLLNSLRATEKGGRVVLSAKKASRSAALIAVSDTGRGIAPELLPNIFKPYMSRKAHGYGIGLAIVSKIVERSGWTIEVVSKIGEGTTITISGVKVL